MSLERLGVGTYKTTCAADTEYFGELIAPCLEDGDVLILTGGLGVGKTHFTKGVSMCWAMRVLACWNGANNSRTS